MALAQYRILFNQAYRSYRSLEVGYFTAAVAKELVRQGVGAALDAIPGTTPAVPAGSPAQHSLRIAATLDVPSSEADRQLLAAQMGVLS